MIVVGRLGLDAARDPGFTLVLVLLKACPIQKRRIDGPRGRSRA